MRVSVSCPLLPHEGRVGGWISSIGVERSDWYAEARKSEDGIVVTVTAPNPTRALQQLVTSGDPLDCWFKNEVRAATGVGLASLFRTELLPRRVLR